MTKYTKQLVLDYIYGNDIKDNNIDELEDNASFMKEVIEVSKDKKMYLFASDKVKKNYDFVKAIVQTFKENQNFIMEVANYYLDNAIVEQDDMSIYELNVIMNNLIKDKNKRFLYAFACMNFYETLLIELRCEYNAKKSKEELPEFGLGFIYIYDIYKESSIITNFFATKMINNIFYNSDLSLEKLLHKNFKSPEVIYKTGVNNVILNYIANYDTCLYGYVATNINLLKDIQNEINKVLNNWNLYETNIYEEKFDIIWQEGLNKYNECNLSYTFYDFLYIALEKLNLIELYKKYDNEINSPLISENDMDFENRTFIRYLENLISSVFNEKNIDEIIYGCDEKNTAKVIKFPKKA